MREVLWRRALCNSSDLYELKPGRGCLVPPCALTNKSHARTFEETLRPIFDTCKNRNHEDQRLMNAKILLALHFPRAGFQAIS